MSGGLGGVVTSFQPSNVALWDEDRGDLYVGRQNWNYQRRGANVIRNPTPWLDEWPLSKMCSGDPSTNLTVTGCDVSDGRIGSGFELWSYGESGQSGLAFIRGQCLDVNGNSLSGASVQAFRTSDNLLAGTTLSDANGNYQVGTPYPGVNHYCVAYYSSGSLAGTTVNSLTPTS